MRVWILKLNGYGSPIFYCLSWLLDGAYGLYGQNYETDMRTRNWQVATPIRLIPVIELIVYASSGNEFTTASEQIYYVKQQCGVEYENQTAACNNSVYNHQPPHKHSHSICITSNYHAINHNSCYKYK